MRCSATVTRDCWHLTPHDKQCRREAVEDGLCRQHHGIRWCRARGCDKQSVAKAGQWWFCWEHWRLWAEHNLIVERIYEFRPRR